MAFIQWNIRGLQANREELNIMLSSFDPIGFSLQETFICNDAKCNFSNFNFFYKSAIETNGIIHGGVALLVKKSVPHSVVNLNTDLQAVAARVTCHRTITVCSLYLPPSSCVTAEQIDKLLMQLPPPVLLLGDFNAHSTLWGNKSTDRKGKLVENTLLKHNLSLLNDNSTTYLHPGTGSATAIDLSLCSPDIFLDMEWSVGDDQCGSDHYPIFIKCYKTGETVAASSWKLSKANWEKFVERASSELGSLTSDTSIDTFTSTLIQIAADTIPTSKSGTRKHNTIWFNEACKAAIRDRRKALKKVKSAPSHENLDNYKYIRAKTRRTIKSTRRQSWQRFVNSVNCRTSIKKVWRMIQKISGKKAPVEIHHLKSGNTDITSVSDIADKLGATFSQNSSSNNCTATFKHHKSRTERQHLKFKSSNKEPYNNLFSSHELLDAIHKSHDSAVGPDAVHYQMLKHLPDCALSSLLTILNNIWTSGNFPDSWRRATVIPVPKPNKDKTDPSSYRPISLTSCLCKIMERMINVRLVWYLEKHKLITPFQSGFRKGRSTTDHLLRLETFIREAFVNRQHVSAIFFDLEKAYDTTWKHGVMRDLHDAGLRGRLPEFINGFMHDRQFSVRLGGIQSQLFSQELGVPQGCILSVTLFCLKINSIVKCVCPGVECSLYVDDFLICYRSKYIHIIERHLQQCLNKLQHWADTNGFKFSTSKTVCMHFCKLRKTHPDPVLTLNGHAIPVVEENKFLGVIFDRKLSFIPHIKYLKDRCMKAVNLLRVLSNTSWGADQQTLLHLYRSLIRSKMDYGCIVYGSAKPSYLKMLEPVQNCALRLCLGAFRTSPSTSLCVESVEPPLDIRRKRLSLQYAAKLASNPTNPAHNSVFKPQFKIQFSKKPTQTATLGIRMISELNSLGIGTKSVEMSCIPAVPPWTLGRPSVDLALTEYRKDSTNPTIYKNKFFELRDTLYKNCVELFTDGSKIGCRTSAAVIYNNKSRSMRLPDGSSIFTAELKAIELALKWILTASGVHFVIYSDSLSSLVAINQYKINNKLVFNVVKLCTDIGNRNKNVSLCWIPSHVGIGGNEKADVEAKAALSKPVSRMKLPADDFLPSIKVHCTNVWQHSWDSCVTNKLHSIQPTVGVNRCHNIGRRRDSVVVSRLRIGHTRLTHSYLLTRDDAPQCETCCMPLTVRHILVECKRFDSARLQYFGSQRLSVGDLLLNSILLETLLNFLRHIGLYTKF